MFQLHRLLYFEIFKKKNIIIKKTTNEANCGERLNFIYLMKQEK